mmetsp:Transcript_21245/g.32246  ORF Transcript_21245/g.32246 Transcript_21245/m.32246 type:complete len:121 (-) Transcript_21245:185-547(-)
MNVITKEKAQIDPAKISAPRSMNLMINESEYARSSSMLAMHDFRKTAQIDSGSIRNAKRPHCIFLIDASFPKRITAMLAIENPSAISGFPQNMKYVKVARRTLTTSRKNLLKPGSWLKPG